MPSINSMVANPYQNPNKAMVVVATTVHVTSLAGLQTIDGYTLQPGDSLLVWKQNNPAHNGIYFVNNSGPYTWERRRDMITTDTLLAGANVLVVRGTANGGKVFLLDPIANAVIGTTALNFRLDFGSSGPGVDTDDQTASEVPVTPTGNLSSTNVQAALQELQGDIDAFVDSDDQIASEVPFTSSGDITSTDVQTAVEEVRNDTDVKLATKVTGPSSSTDNAIARYDQTTGKLIQDSAAKLNDDGSFNLPVFTYPRTSVDGDAWLEIESGKLLFKIKHAGVTKAVELT